MATLCVKCIMISTNTLIITCSADAWFLKYHEEQYDWIWLHSFWHIWLVYTYIVASKSFVKWHLMSVSISVMIIAQILCSKITILRVPPLPSSYVVSATQCNH